MAVTTIFEEQELSLVQIAEEGPYGCEITPATFALTIDQEYQVKWNDHTYLCTAFDASDILPGGVGIGNRALLGGEDTGEPFGIGYVPADEDVSLPAGSVFFAFEGELHTVAIYQGTEDDTGTDPEEPPTEEPEEPPEDEPEEPAEGIVLKDRNGKDVAYYGIETVTFDTTTEGKQQTYTKGVKEDKTVALDMAAGDLTIEPDTDKLFGKVTVTKPETMLPENIRSGVEIGGVVGDFIGDTEEATVALSMAEGDQVIEPSDALKVLSRVTIQKPETLVPENIVKDVDIGGVIGINEGSGGEKNPPVWIDSVCFWDIDGTLIQYMSVKEAAELTELPTPPAHDKLVFAGWNYTLEEIRTLGRPLDIGAMYDTVGGKIYITLKITSTYYKAPSIHFMQSMANGVSVDWGDGSTSTSGATVDAATSLSHTYSAVGEKEVVITIADGCTVTIGGGTSSTTMSGSDTQYKQVPVKVYLPRGVKLAGSALSSISNIELLNLPPDLTELPNYSVSSLSRLKYIVIPNQVTTIGDGVFQSCFSDAYSYNTRSGISIPENITSVGTSFVTNAYTLRRIVLPTKMTELPNQCLRNAYSITRAFFPPNLTTIGNYVINGWRSIQKLEIPPTLATVGTENFANLYSLEEIHVPPLMTTIPGNFCKNAYRLRKCVLHDSIVSIGTGFLGYTYGVLEVDIPASVTDIGSSFLNSCYGVQRVILRGDIKTLGDSYMQTGYVKEVIVLHDTPSTNLINLIKRSGTWTAYVPDEAFDAYKSGLGNNHNTYILPLSEYNGDILNNTKEETK